MTDEENPTTAITNREEPSRRMRFLVVDDEEAFSRVVQRSLPEYEVVVSLMAREALSHFERGERFDVILCDVMMPEMSGPDLFAALQRVAPEQIDRVIFMTGGVLVSSMRGYLELTKRPILHKPFSRDMLREAVRRVLEGT